MKGDRISLVMDQGLAEEAHTRGQGKGAVAGPLILRTIPTHQGQRITID